jgi:hypothetical protein
MNKTLRQYITELERLADKHGDGLSVVVRTGYSFRKYTYDDVYKPKIVTPKTNPRVLVNPV